MVPEPGEAPTSADDVPHDTLGTPGAPPLVLLHGFTQNRHCWGELPHQLSSGREVLVADAPGHGDAATLALSLADAAGRYADALAPRQPATWLGYSMGGRLALHVALAAPEAVSGLVLVGTSAGIADPTERARRRADDEALADRVETLGTAAFVDEWLSQPLFAGLTPETDQRAARLRNDPRGLASSLRLAGTGAQAPLWDDLHHIDVPVLLVVGERDTKFASIAEQLRDRLGGPCDVEVLAGCGHACHLEDPAAFTAVVGSWLDGAAQAGTP